MEKNKHGNTVERSFTINGDRYRFDFRDCTKENGWLQYDTSQDAWYFGVWVHPEKMEIVTYAEGDITRVKCDTKKSFKAEIKSMNEFYGEAPASMIAISMDGKVTEYHDTEAHLLSE